LVVDATGFAREFVRHDCEFDPGYQVTYGALFRVKDLGPYQLDRMVLMDYCERHLYESPELTASNERFPSFVYAMPLAKDKLFLEETVLVSRPGASSRDLQARLKLRMKALGIEALEVLEEERAAIPMGGMDPVVPQRTLGFGATSSLVHPASGYMVARAMEIAPRVAAAVAPALKELRGSAGMTGGALDEVAAAGWNAVWPTDERRQRDFMHFGFELLCLLNPQELRDFFTGFFRLPDALWEHFLSWRLSGIGHIVMGFRVWAQCIPRRFMPAMLIKSIPFLPNRLIGPGLSRGNFAKIDTESVYADARTQDHQLWEPNNFYPYLEQLSNRDDFKKKSPAVLAEIEKTATHTNKMETKEKIKS
jgi:lycopene cyclase-like protein